MESLKLFTKTVELSEVADNGNLKLRFILCDFEPNLNGVALDRSTIESWMGTIINQPLVGKIRVDGKDFMGHEMKLRNVFNPDTGESEREVIFDTQAVGTFYNVEIQTIDGVEYLVADAEVWARFPNVIKIIRTRMATEEGLHTSWEILIKEKELRKGIEVITNGEFIGHCLLSQDTTPAYGCSRILCEAASVDDDEPLYEAIMLDVASQKEKTMDEFEVVVNEEPEVASEEPTAEVVEEETPEVSEAGEPADPIAEPAAEEPAVEPEGQTEEVETSALTDWDLRRHLEEEMRRRHAEDKTEYWLAYLLPADSYALFHTNRGNELDFVEATYEVVDNEVHILTETEVTLVTNLRDLNSFVAAKDNALAEANAKILSLTEENATLEKYKEAAEKEERRKAKAERDQKVAELRNYALKSQLITEAEANEGKIAKLISELNESAIKAIIAERFMAQMETSAAKEPAEEIVASSLIDDEDTTVVNPIAIYVKK